MACIASWRWARATVAALAAAGCAQVPDAPPASGAPQVDGPYVGTLPCADCAGIRTELTLYSAAGGVPLRYRLRSTYLATRDGDRVFERFGPWQRVRDPVRGVDRIRLEPFDYPLQQNWRRLDDATLELLDREVQPIGTAREAILRRDRGAGAAPAPGQRLFAGTLTRVGERLLLQPCDAPEAQPVRDVSPEVVITAVLTDLGFDRRGSIYLEAFGRMVDGVAQLQRLNRAGSEMGCPGRGTAAPPLFRAQGNEPFWSLTGSAREIAFAQPGRTATEPPAPLSWRWRGGDAARAQAHLNIDSGAFSAVLVPGICRDSMADAAYGFAATVRMERPVPRELKGCAYLGAEPLP